MTRNDPLLVQRPSSEQSAERSDAEEDALLTGQRTYRDQDRRGATFWRQIGLFAWALLATAAVIILAVAYQHQQSTGKGEGRWRDSRPMGKRNLIFMVSDGMGPSSLSMTRSFRQLRDGLPIDDILVLDKHHIGQSRTRSTSSLVTDSAAGATAFSCAKKSYNGAIAVLPDHTPCGTVLEAAKAAGYLTGLVVTTRITDATPACFSSHANMRSYEDLIAEHQIGEYPLGRQVDLILGGGRCHFLPNSTSGSCRGDNKDIVRLAQSKGFSYFDDRKGFDALKLGTAVKLPLLGLVADKDVPYEIDRRYQNDTYPSLEEMTRTALKALSDATRDSDQGFFIMIEGSRIDHAGHGNDPAAQVHEVLAYDRAFAAVLEFLEKDSTPGVVVSTSDHETGGLAVARQLHQSYPDYKWFPGVLVNASHSSEYLQARLDGYLNNEGKSAPKKEQSAYVRRHFLENGLGIYDAKDAEIDSLLRSDSPIPAAYIFADMVSRRAQIGWSTHGHSAADVNIYASSPRDVMNLLGNRENTEVGDFLVNYLDLDLDSITEKLNGTKTTPKASSNGYAWMGAPLDSDVVVDTLDIYHGDFKKRSLSWPSEVVSTDGGCGCGMAH
ncbi:vacuolar alkaline phosphatase [Ophidiomyces ophidiicola]|uniref:Vacuolar alkaline phosphatase n=1 Tax=Ophidiomyces ophidiicola TaxID=1387563 RepID=A0ACB8UU35_9EURO|nr:vacuolar alkaline phosphatase [Ophidiomyces ophidiicola]KAI1907669.1 vacuolar alkaline phosphatase [Ophidiomyces ophidiicola]KAI1910884.1 vacuolar alkaline phosphatase [Ophidiomyces ophidiicola]KAI1925296.1 vacuolar alkaline phosphatase [Ophidiomyces ophidiicola]KAI1937440.1 vacuolar alkaline phosphatase [Ophidiomyces ophidiicola]KAI1951817.1 vacuolar alkaline phosphatase [Ophidiomyces ophidiicola]